MSDKVLCVDDDTNLLASLRRSLRGRFDLTCAASGQEALDEIQRTGPFAVILADMRMPQMDGVSLLKKVQQRTPDTVRMMLTGNADVETAMEAVNHGHIFRFMAKPCAKEDLITALESGIRQYQLVTAEKQLLDGTLKGSLGVTVDILSMVNPAAFGRTRRILRYVRHIVAAFGLPEPWKYEVAAMLCQLGCVALAPELLNKAYAGGELSSEEQSQYASHPELGGQLVSRIPRLETVAEMIARQDQPCRQTDGDPAEQDEARLGGRVLQVALAFDRLLMRGLSPAQASHSLQNQPDEYDPALAEALASYDMPSESSPVRALRIDQLRTGLVLDEDVRATNGRLLATTGQEVTEAMIEHLRRWNQGVGVAEPLRVVVN
jgi:response regulator RpfG family c-di-GMP phosphodiesterase